MTAWIILITENIFLLIFLLIWINRYCLKCQKVKCIERIFNRICQTCQEKEQNHSKNNTSRPKKSGEIKL